MIHGLRNVLRTETHHKLSASETDHQRLQFFTQWLVVKIFNNTNHSSGLRYTAVGAHPFQLFPDVIFSPIKFFGCRFIDDKCFAGISGEFGGKKPSGSHFQSQHILNIMTGEDGANPFGFLLRHSLRHISIGNTIGQSRYAPADLADCLDILVLEQFVFECRELLPGRTKHVKENHLLLIKSQFFVLHIIQLIVDDADTDQQGKRYDELGDDQYFSQQRLAAEGVIAGINTSLQYTDWTKTGEYKGRITTGDYPH